MFCCGGADEEPAGPPANQYNSAPPNKAGNPNFGGGNRGEPRNTNAPRSGGPAKVLPIEIPAVALDELNRMTSNFGNKALIGEGSYGRVFQGKYNGDDVAIKKLDASSSEEPDSDFTSQVHIKYHKTDDPSAQTSIMYAGSGIGGLLSAVHAFNTGIPDLQNRFPGSKRLSFLVGVPLLLGYSGVGAAFGGNMIFFGDLLHFVPKSPELFDLVTIFDQLTVTSYYASSSASHYGISMLTRHIEEYYLSRTLKE
ncbi:hypothetical protein F2Q68_00028267 [Brassica cretica]|uniref:Protein kinase domain-containing protein n=1 Tax=Brassica cretica TaxID=69181 RepID=A0A8S9I999_BRACR|nr:hypothetical protein F2Q68_00028267 [Brassica cretica]